MHQRLLAAASALLAAAGTCLAAATLYAIRIDLSKGVIAGRMALAAWPALPNTTQPLDPKGYQLVLANADAPDRPWLRYPAGTWQLPPIGQYLMLLEGTYQVSPFPANLKFMREPFNGKGWAILHHVVPAGRIVPRGSCPSNPCLAWLLHDSSNVQSPIPYYGPQMLRRLPLAEASRAGVLMPAGRVAVAVYDPTAKRFLGVQVPLDVKASTTVASQPGIPKPGRAALILELSRGTRVYERREDDLNLQLVAADGQRRSPAILARWSSGVTAIWTDVPAGTSRLEVRSSKDRLTDAPVQLRPQTIEHVRRALTASR